MDPNREQDILSNYDFVTPVVMTGNEQQISSNYDRSSLISVLYNSNVATGASAALQSPIYHRGNVMNSRWYGLGESHVGRGDHLITNSHGSGYSVNNNNAHEFQYEQSNNSNMVGSNRQSIYQEMAYPMATRSTNSQSLIAREQEWEEACIPKSRWIPTAEQIHVLESLFNAGTTTPSRDQIAEITVHLKKYGNVGEANIFYWFQNRKARAKRKLRQAAASSVSGSTTERRGRENSAILQASSQNKTDCRRFSTKTSSGSSPDNNNLLSNDPEYDPYAFQLQNEASAFAAAIAESKAIQQGHLIEPGNSSCYGNSQICDSSSNIRHPYMPGKMVIEQNVLDPRMSLSLAPPAQLHIVGDSLLPSNPRRALDPFTTVDPSASTSSIERTEHGSSVYQEKFWGETYRSFNSLPSDEWERKQ